MWNISCYNKINSILLEWKSHKVTISSIIHHLVWYWSVCFSAEAAARCSVIKSVHSRILKESCSTVFTAAMSSHTTALFVVAPTCVQETFSHLIGLLANFTLRYNMIHNKSSDMLLVFDTHEDQMWLHCWLHHVDYVLLFLIWQH